MSEIIKEINDVTNITDEVISVDTVNFNLKMNTLKYSILESIAIENNTSVNILINNLVESKLREIFEERKIC